MTKEPISDFRWSRSTVAGLIVALLVPFATYAAGRAAFGTAFSPTRIAIGLAAHWVNLAVLIAIVVLWERRPLASIGFVPIRWWTIPAGLVAAVAITFVAGILVSALALNADSRFARLLQSFPVFLRLLIVLTAGVFEETLYRGYATERLTTLLGSKWLAGGCTVVFFTLAHVPAVGLTHLLPVAIISIPVTLLYLWRRDLILNMVTHVAIDGIGLLLAPLASR
jgi:membrane protease YdiL (CAAX protease family)